MFSDRTQNWLTLTTNFGVIISLLLLAYEINQSTKATIAAASEGLTEHSLAYMAARLDNEVVARATFKHREGQQLEGIEHDQLVLLQHLNFRLFESAYLQYRRGFYEQSEWERYQRIIATAMRDNEHAKEMWNREEGGWTAEFADEVERIRNAKIVN
jgi:putative heme iron utilization protein